jgi:hypothetical protein
MRGHVLGGVDDARRSAVGKRLTGRTSMRNLFLVGAFALLVLSPLTAAAQQKPAVPTPSLPPTIEGVPTAKILVIGAGVLAGAVVVEAIAGGEVFAVIGGAAGGLIGAWWYDSANGSLTHASLREPAGLPEAAHAQRLATAR